MEHVNAVMIIGSLLAMVVGERFIRPKEDVVLTYVVALPALAFLGAAAAMYVLVAGEVICLIPLPVLSGLAMSFGAAWLARCALYTPEVDPRGMREVPIRSLGERILAYCVALPAGFAIGCLMILCWQPFAAFGLAALAALAVVARRLKKEEASHAAC